MVSLGVARATLDAATDLARELSIELKRSARVTLDGRVVWLTQVHNLDIHGHPLDEPGNSR